VDVRASGSKSKTHVTRGTIFGKPRSQVVKHPGVFSAAARRAGVSTQAYARSHKNDSGTLGRRARLALTFSKMRRTKGR
jgi:hypothetical protein